MGRHDAGRLAVWCKSRPDLRHHAGMGDRYRTADGWAVEVVALSATPDGNDGERLKITYRGFFVALVRTVGELETWFPLSDLEPEALTPWRQIVHGLAVFRLAVSAPRSPGSLPASAAAGPRSAPMSTSPATAEPGGRSRTGLPSFMP